MHDATLTDALHVHSVAKRDVARILTALTAYWHVDTKASRARLRTIARELRDRWLPDAAPLAEIDEMGDLPMPVPQFGRGDLDDR